MNRTAQEQVDFDDKEEHGQHTAHLFLYAMEKSGCAPEGRVMNLDDDHGAAAFLRAVQYQLSLEYTYYPINKMGPYLHSNKIGDNVVDGTRTLKASVDRVEELESYTIPICKVSVNPLLIFLHVDQGCFRDVGYTPFASMIANNRSLHQHHVEGVIDEVKKGNPIVSQEDFAITAFDVALDCNPIVSQQGDISLDGNNGIPFTYRCTLNRDPQSDITVKGKKATEATFDSLDNLYHKVSLATQS